MKAAPRRPRIRRLPILLIALLLGLELSYLGTAQVMIRSGLLERLLNRRPEKLMIRWERVSTWYPGQVDVRGLRIRSHSRASQLWIAADRARGRISLARLPRRVFRATGIRAEGVDLRLRRTAPVDDPRRPVAPHQPEIPGLNPETPAPQRRSRRRPFITELELESVEQFPQVWVEGYRILGDLRLSGRACFQGSREAEIPGAVAVLQAGEIRIGDQRVAHGLEARVEFRTEPFNPRTGKTAAFLAHSSGSARMRGQVRGGSLLNALLRGGRTPRFETGPGRLDLDLSLVRGLLTEGSRLELASPAGAVRFLGWWGAGETLILGRVGGPRAAPLLHLEAEIRDVRVAADDEPDRPFLVAPELRIGMELGADLAGLHSGGVPVGALDLEMCGGEIPDLAAVSFLLPESAGLRVNRGLGRLDLAARIAPRGSHGLLELQMEEIQGTFHGQPVAGRLSLSLPLEEGDPVETSLGIAGARLVVDNRFRVRQEPREPWEGEIRIQQGSVGLERPHRAIGSLRLSMTDTRPLVDHFARDSRIVELLGGLLEIENVTGRARFEVAPRSILLEDARVTGEGLLLLANLRLRQGDASGILFSRFKGLSFGVELEGEKARLRLRKPRRWFDREASRRE